MSSEYSLSAFESQRIPAAENTQNVSMPETDRQFTCLHSNPWLTHNNGLVYIEFKDIFGQCKFFNNLDKLF